MAYYEYEFPQQKIFEVKDLPSINNSNKLYIDRNAIQGKIFSKFVIKIPNK